MSRKAKVAIILLVDSLIIIFASLISNVYLGAMMSVSRRYMVFALGSSSGHYISYLGTFLMCSIESIAILASVP